MAIDRTNYNALVDDSGLGTDGSIVSKTTFKDVVLDQVDKLVDGTSDVTSLKFAATQVPSGNVNTLDDYEEGTWTPVIGGSGGTSGQTYTNQEGRYIKIGSFVWASCNVVLSAKGTITGNVEIQGLPFTAENGALQFYEGSVSWGSTATSFIRINGWVPQNTTKAQLFGITAAATSDNGAPLATADLNNSSGFRCLFVYRAAN